MRNAIENTQVDIDANPTTDAPPVRVVDVHSKANIILTSPDVRTKLGETTSRSRNRVRSPIICLALADLASARSTSATTMTSPK